MDAHLVDLPGSWPVWLRSRLATLLMIRRRPLGFSLPAPAFIQLAKTKTPSPGLAQELLRFAGVAVVGLGLFQTLLLYITQQLTGLAASPLLLLFMTVGTIICVLLYCRTVEERSLASLGLQRRGAGREFLLGLALGAGLLALAVGICLLTGSLVYAGNPGTGAADLTGGDQAVFSAGFFALLIAYLLGFLIQGASEELLCRGYLLVSLSRRHSLVLAIVVSSLAFTLLHIFNNGLGVLPVLNLLLFGGLCGIWLLKRGSLWGVMALHGAWNFMEGNVFGGSVSGSALLPSVLILTPAAGAGHELMAGGSFGLEGGLAVSAVLLAAILAALLMPAC